LTWNAAAKGFQQLLGSDECSAATRRPLVSLGSESAKSRRLGVAVRQARQTAAEARLRRRVETNQAGTKGSYAVTL